jgi:hypothetical protein
VKYCPNLVCPHRQRVSSPAEFLDQIVVCSDCNTMLVESEVAAIEGLEAPAPAPYRSPGVKGERAQASKRKANDAAVGWALIVGGVALTALTYVAAAAGAGDGRYMFVWGPIAYGIYRLTRR